MSEVGHKPTEPKKIAVLPKTGDRGDSNRGHEGSLPELFPGSRIGEMNLDGWDSDPSQSITK